MPWLASISATVAPAAGHALEFTAGLPEHPEQLGLRAGRLQGLTDSLGCPCDQRLLATEHFAGCTGQMKIYCRGIYCRGTVWHHDVQLPLSATQISQKAYLN
jgi:hypothetical protein